MYIMAELVFVVCKIIIIIIIIINLLMVFDVVAGFKQYGQLRTAVHACMLLN